MGNFTWHSTSVIAPTKQQSIKTDGNSENNSGATLKINGITLEINNNASPELIRNLIGAVAYETASGNSEITAPEAIFVMYPIMYHLFCINWVLFYFAIMLCLVCHSSA